MIDNESKAKSYSFKIKLFAAFSDIKNAYGF